MKKYLIPKEGRFYKANLHCHSTVSDGKNTPEEMKDFYKANGYDILAITDHELLVDHSHLSDPDFLVLTGYEYAICDGSLEDLKVYDKYVRMKTIEFNLYPKDQHNETQVMFSPEYVVHGEVYRAPNVKCYGEYIKREYSMEFAQRFIDEANKNGFLVALNHPSLSLEDTYYLKDLRGLISMEMINQGTFYGSAEYNAQMYDYFLRNGMRIGCTASDDNHIARIYGNENDIRPWAFTMIKARELTASAVLNAMEKGDMYSTQGPIINELYIEDNKIHASFSNAKAAVMKTNLRYAPEKIAATNEYINEACFDLIDDLKYVRFTVIDEYGRYADTRGYFLDEI